MLTKTIIPLLLLAVLFVPSMTGATTSPTASATPGDKGSTASNGRVTGTVKDLSGAVLPGAQIVLQPAATTAVSDTQGNYMITNVTPGTYTLTVTYVGFKEFVSTITVTAGQTTSLDARLTVGSANQQVVVNATLNGDAAEINEQRTSENILNVMTAPTIMSLPNANVGDALGRLPGVTLVRNEGQAQYVQIRGTEPRLSNTTIDGVIVPGPDPQVRQVDLEVIPAALVGAVEINKTLSANQNGDAIGGSVDMKVKQATGDRPTFSIQSTGGYTPIDTGQPEFLDTATVGKRFGTDKRWGVMLSYSYDLNDLGTDDVEPSPDLDSNGNPTFDDIHIQEYFYNQTRWGFAGSLDYKVNENSDLFLHGLISNYKDYGQKFTYDVGNGGSGTYSTSVRRPNYQIALLSMGGNHVFNHSYAKYEIAAARSRFGAAAGNPGADFVPFDNGLPNNLYNLTSCVYSAAATVSVYRPQWVGCTTPGASVYDPTQYQLNDINLTSGQSTQINLQAGGAMGINYHLGTHTSTLEFGGQFRNEHKGQDAYSPTYDCNGPTGCTANGNPVMTQFTTSFTNPSYYGGSYHMGPVTNFDLITRWLAANPGAMPLDEGATHLNSDASNYNLQERVSAGYIMNTLDLSSKLHLQTGLRIEATQTSDTGYLVVNDANGNYLSTTPEHGSGSYVNPLPSVQLRYSIDQNSDIRAVYGRGISRPDPYQLVPYETLDESSNPNTVGIGNPSLVAEHANDYDVLYEKFLPSVGMVEAGYFYKQITLPLYSVQKIIPNPFPNPITPTAYLQQEVNGDHAHVQGIEVAYQQHMTYLPGVLKGARIDANFTYTGSKNYNLVGRSDNPALVGQAPFSYNINPSFATKRAHVTVAISNNGANIATYQYQDSGPNAVGGGIKGPLGDNYYYSHTQVDTEATYYLGKGFTFIASGQNMNNAVFGFYNGSTQYMTQREYYKPMYSGGIRWELRRSDGD
jgi:TonB-dependent receptor